VVLGARNQVVTTPNLTPNHFPQVATILDTVHQRILPLTDYRSTVDQSPEALLGRLRQGL